MIKVHLLISNRSICKNSGYKIYPGTVQYSEINRHQSVISNIKRHIIMWISPVLFSFLLLSLLTSILISLLAARIVTLTSSLSGSSIACEVVLSHAYSSFVILSSTSEERRNVPASLNCIAMPRSLNSVVVPTNLSCVIMPTSIIHMHRRAIKKFIQKVLC